MLHVFKFVQDFLVGREEPSGHKVVKAEKRVANYEERLRILTLRADVKSRGQYHVR